VTALINEVFLFVFHFLPKLIMNFLKYEVFGRSGQEESNEKTQRAREHALKNIIKLYQDVEKITPPFLESQDISKLSLQVSSLDTIGQKGESYKSEDQVFFEPLSEEALGRFPVIGIDLDRLEGCEDAFEPTEDESLVSAADGICLEIAWQATLAIRDGIPEVDGSKQSLGFYQGWRFQE
jgi:hypothetical protein